MSIISSLPFTIDHALAMNYLPWETENGQSTVNSEQKKVNE